MTMNAQKEIKVGDWVRIDPSLWATSNGWAGMLGIVEDRWHDGEEVCYSVRLPKAKWRITAASVSRVETLER